MASSSSNSHVTLEVGEEHTYTYPYPSNLSATGFTTVKLSGRDEYGMWKTQMLCLLESHGMLGFIDGTLMCPQPISISGKEKVGDHQTHYRLWRRSDALVKGWIFGSLSKPTLGYVLDRLHQQRNANDFSGKDAWDELHTMYAPVGIPPELLVVEDTPQDKDRAKNLDRLYNYTEAGYWNGVEDILRQEKVAVTDKITNNGNTALHAAVGSFRGREFLEKLLEKIPENTQLTNIRNSDGSTLLHVAAISGNNETADILVARDPHMLLAKDKEGQTPLALALSNMHTHTARHLLRHINTLTDDIQKDALFSGTTGDDLLVTVISSKDFVISCIIMSFLYILGMLVYLFFKEGHQNFEDAIGLLAEVSMLIREKNHFSSYHHYYTNPILEASRQNAYEFVDKIMHHFPNAIWSANEDGHNIIQYAVVNRSEKIYNLLYWMSQHRNICRTIKDSSGNNLLHLATRLAPNNKLNLISGEALQIQRELQWFKEVERFICPLSIIQKNSFNETPQTIFTREHKELVIEGQKWMKSTAESYTITAALIITIVFAAAITVPGGNKQEGGLPVFTNHTAFTIFAISDAISLFSAVTSLLMFLSILTARFAEQDFLFKLPTKLIIGLATLFISTTAMIVAFAATLYLVFGQSNSRILIPIAVLTCLPITSFVTLQFPLVIELMSATYGGSIFGDKQTYYPLY
ncbi:ankyrin repeat-containing protein ITN1 isoform X3 [Lactuca sativa]|uniref:ankyrin repeat-containing protein ITN1 isoform X3 n=1 Tax=Lactuca sativa TaxID=4236 RepID=UPI001C6896E7|nr:ankyrin repeat-containing protein ITN1 isoform X3 [Lactuca sativa]